MRDFNMTCNSNKRKSILSNNISRNNLNYLKIKIINLLYEFILYIKYKFNKLSINNYFD